MSFSESTVISFLLNPPINKNRSFLYDKCQFKLLKKVFVLISHRRDKFSWEHCWTLQRGHVVCFRSLQCSDRSISRGEQVRVHFNKRT